jgi:hypothetical protein
MKIAAAFFFLSPIPYHPQKKRKPMNLSTREDMFQDEVKRIQKYVIEKYWFSSFDHPRDGQIHIESTDSMVNLQKRWTRDKKKIDV